jgi:hypothetical protein
MCLDFLLGTNPNPEGEGYKIFRQRPGESLRALYCDCGEGYATGEWINERSYRVSNHGSNWIQIAGIFHGTKQYPTGFHFFTTLSDAQYYLHGYHGEAGSPVVIKKIKYRGGVAYGSYCNSDVIVAKEIFIEEE